MLYTKIVGDVGELKTNWYDYEDEYGNRIFTCDSLKQKLRLFNHVSSKLDEIYVNEDSSCYDIDDNVAFTNSNKNMNLSLIKSFSKGFVQRSILYLSLNGIRVYGYKPLNGARIVQTFSSQAGKGFRGAVITFVNTSKPFLRVEMAKKYNGERKIYDLIIIDDEVKMIENTRYDPLEDENWIRESRFFITCKSGVIPTSTILVNATNKELVEEVKEVAKDIKNSNIVLLPAGNDTFEPSNFDEESNDAIDEMFNNVLIKDRNRAITVVGLKYIPKEFLLKYNILYLFELDPETGIIRNTKSC